MRRLFIFAAVFALATPGSVQAQSNPAASPIAPGAIAGPSNVPSPGAASPRNQVDPALNLHGMPCSVSLNATGGVTTSSSCGSDPLEVPARTLASPDQASVTSAPPAQTSAGGSEASGQGTAGATTQRGSSSQTAGATSSASAGRSASSGTSTLCSQTMPTTTGSSTPGSLFGAGC